VRGGYGRSGQATYVGAVSSEVEGTGSVDGAGSDIVDEAFFV